MSADDTSARTDWHIVGDIVATKRKRRRILRELAAIRPPPRCIKRYKDEFSCFTALSA
ncbi:hypothetical protein DFQ27_009679, partial [Actinomortierella ambigua]